MERVSVFLLSVPKKKKRKATERSVNPNLLSVEDAKWFHVRKVHVTCSREKACCLTEPGGDERVTLGGAVQALFALRQGGVEQQVSVGQHS